MTENKRNWMFEAEVHMNLSEILGSLKRDWKGKKRLLNTTSSCPTPQWHPRLLGNCLVCIYQFLTSNSNFKQHQIFKIWCGNSCFGAQVSSKYGTWYSERVILQFMCVGCLAGVTCLRYRVLTSPKKDETAVHCYQPALSVLVMLVSRNVFHVVSALQSIVLIHIFSADQACVSQKTRKLFGPVKPLQNLEPCDYRAVLFT